MPFVPGGERHRAFWAEPRSGEDGRGLIVWRVGVAVETGPVPVAGRGHDLPIAR